MNNKIMDPMGLTPPMAWEQEPVREVPPRGEPVSFEWNFLYTEVILAVLFVVVVGWLFRKRK